MNPTIETEKIEKTSKPGWGRNERGRRWVAEAVGTFTIVFAACAASVTDKITGGQVTLVGNALASGLAVTAMIYAVGHICGAHFNPAVTLAFSLARHFPLKEVPGYIAAQICGATMAATTVRLLFGDVGKLGGTYPAGEVGQSFAFEIIISFFLMFVITSVATDTRAVGAAAALAIGLTVVMAILVAGPTSGAAMNPARSFGPALISENLKDNWVYWLGPVIGAALGASLYQFLRGDISTKEVTKEN